MKPDEFVDAMKARDAAGEPTIREKFRDALRDLDVIRADIAEGNWKDQSLRVRDVRNAFQEVLDELDLVFDVVAQVTAEIQIIALVDLAKAVSREN